MKYKVLGKTKEKIPAIGLGTWVLSADTEKEVESLRAGFDNGIGFVDTAEAYGTEPIVGKALKGYKNIFVATKVSPIHFHYEDVIRSCDASLRTLGIKTIDLYQLHWPNSRVPIKETMRAMEALVRDGKIRHIGVSNFSVGELKEAREALKENEIVSNQIEYSILARSIEKELLGYCTKERITVIAYSPLAHGALYNKKYAKLLGLLSEVGKRYGKTATQVALNWLIQKEPVVAIPKASRKEHVLEIAGSADWKLRREDMNSISGFPIENRYRSPGETFGPHIKRAPFLISFMAWFEHRRFRKSKQSSQA